MTKLSPVSKRMVYNIYLKVAAKDGGAGIDKKSIEQFNENLCGNLYKIWNRMTSGSYFPPPVRPVFIPKKQGGLRPPGIPTVSDRIAQGGAKDYLEPTFESTFVRWLSKSVINRIKLTDQTQYKALLESVTDYNLTFKLCQTNLH